MALAVLTQHNDVGRTGVYPGETELNWDTVAVHTFGKLCSHKVSGLIYAQPLFVPSVEIPNIGQRDIVVVATMDNWIYALDAMDRTGAPAAQLWAHHLGNLRPVPIGAFRQGYADIGGAAKASDIGILSTPVIDAVSAGSGQPTTGTIYIVAMSFDQTKFAATPQHAFAHWLFALDLGTGLPRTLPGGGTNPVSFSGAMPGSGYGAVNRAGPARRVGDRIVFDGKIGTPTLDGSRDFAITDAVTTAGVDNVVFNSMQQLQRPGLLLSDGVIYTGFGSHGDHDPYHGWIFAHDAQTLAMKGVFCTTRNGAQGGVWQAGEGIGADGLGNVYVGTGNGDFGVMTGAFGECQLKLNLDGTGLKLAGFSQAFLDPQGGDEDFGASSPTFLPDGYMVGGGKDGNFYLFDPAKMDVGGSLAALRQLFLASADQRSDPAKTRHIHGAPVTYQNANSTFVYVWGENDLLRCFRYDPVGHTFPGQPNARSAPGTPEGVGQTNASADVPGAGGMPGAMLSVSTNRKTARTAIVWASFPPYRNANQEIVAGELRAYKADEFLNGRLVTLWSSLCNIARDDYGAFAKFCCPTIAAGRVFQASFSGELAVYGRLAAEDGGYNIGFGGNTGLVFNGSAAIVHGQIQLLATPHIFQAGSVFHRDRVDVRAFRTVFVVSMPQSDADGFTFTMQGVSPYALGGAGMGLGYGPNAVSAFDRGARIGQSVAVKFGLINNSTLQPRSSIGLYFDGATPSGGATERDLTVSLHSGHPILIVIEYAGGTLDVSVTDNLTKQQDSQSFQIDVPSNTGNSAYVGFTGGSGGKTSTQMVLSWQFVPLTT